MIRVGSVDEMDSNYENWMIVHSCEPEQVPTYAKQVKELSLSDELFKEYRAAVHANVFTIEWFDEIYIPHFLEDLSKNTKAKFLLKELCEKSNEKDIFLVCFCQEERLCHRSIIAGILLGMGADIETSVEYLKYYDQFMAVELNC